MLMTPSLHLVNLSPSTHDPGFGSGPDASVKAKVINLIASIRTIMRSQYKLPPGSHSFETVHSRIFKADLDI